MEDKRGGGRGGGNAQVFTLATKDGEEAREGGEQDGKKTGQKMREGGDTRDGRRRSDKKSEERGDDGFLFWPQQPPERWGEGGGWCHWTPPGRPCG